MNHLSSLLLNNFNKIPVSWVRCMDEWLVMHNYDVQWKTTTPLKSLAGEGKIRFMVVIHGVGENLNLSGIIIVLP